MQRRTFLRLVGAASVAPAVVDAAAPKPPAATVLFDDRATPLTTVRRDPTPGGGGPRTGNDASALWVRKRDLPRVNDFEVKPQGACRADICIPIPKEMLRGDSFNLTAFAKKVGEVVVSDADARVWSFGEIQALRGSFLNARVAPDVRIPDRRGRPVRLADFRGKKVLLVTWASW
jgi:hypothetical protein